MTGHVSFVGAGPGAPDLLTLRAGAELVASDDRTHDDVVAIYARAARDGLRVARVHSGDPTLYGALHEQIDACRRLGLSYEIVPGVSSLAGAAAALGQELTVPDVSQTLILTRRATRTSMPPNEELTELARHGTTMALFLSVSSSLGGIDVRVARRVRISVWETSGTVSSWPRAAAAPASELTPGTIS